MGEFMEEYGSVLFLVVLITGIIGSLTGIVDHVDVDMLAGGQ